MPRNRVLSFMSQWGSGQRSPESSPSPRPTPSPNATSSAVPGRRPPNIDTTTPQSNGQMLDASAKNSPDSPSTPSRARGDLKPKRPLSMLQTYNPPQVEVAPDTPPELQPIFTFLNSHSNKLYQEGYFLKLHDLDSRGRPSSDRVWNECFAQLVGTVLSLWDASALDVAGEDGEVVPTFINLSDASIKMIESLPMNGAQGGSLQNVLSVSTAANNRYLLHFNSLNSLTQWTAGIRLAMFEHATLQEAYTGSLIAGKGRYLNNIKQIMFKLQFQHEDWARVRFGAGTPWKRCWCVISPPDEKEVKSAQKTLKKSSSYEKVRMPKGNIKFYESRKVTKKTRPIATISDAYAAYAIYPQSKPLIEQSTLVKLEGVLTIHNAQDTTTEGFVFVMPEVHAAVSGFEMMLRWLFPVYDTFGLYGRPQRLIADTLDQRGLMFALPRDRRYGYLDILDVSGLIHTQGSHGWSERHWRREMKKLTADRMMNQMDGGYQSSRQSSQRRATTSRTSLPPPRSGVRFGGEDEMVHSTPGSRSASPGSFNRATPPERTDSAPPGVQQFSPHKRSASEAIGYKKYAAETPSRLSYEATRPGEDQAPPPPRHAPGTLARIQSESEVPTMQSYNDVQTVAESPHMSAPAPVGPPPAFTHQPNSRPPNEPYVPPEIRRANSSVDAATLHQMKDAVRRDHSPDDRESDGATWNGEVQQRQQNTVASQPYANRNLGVPADRSQGVVNRKQREPKKRLSTIPGSPYVGSDAEYFDSHEQNYMPQMDGVAEEPTPSNNEIISAYGAPTPPTPLNSSKSIARKPVPKALAQEPAPDVPASLDRSVSNDDASPETESWEGGYIDEETLERVLNERSNTLQTTKTTDTAGTAGTTESSEPDYASTVSASPPKKSVERPRAGKLKIVGDPALLNAEPQSENVGGPSIQNAPQASDSKDIPNVDFGPTYAMKPSSRPGTSGTLTQDNIADNRRSRSAERLTSVMGTRAQSNPHESQRLSYFSDRKTPSPGRMTPEVIDQRSDNAQVAWQPGAVPGILHRSQTSVTPEQWVQQKAAMAQQPQYALPPKKTVPDRYNTHHGRSTSGQGPRKLTKPPPANRVSSADWVDQMRQTPSPRPHSRGASVNLDLAANSLSAREQMQVSRATGSPLINMAHNPNKTPQEDQPGLIGAMAQRERERAILKEGRNSMAVQQAIERQQQQMRMEAEAQAQQQYQMQMQAQQQQQPPMNWNQTVYVQNQQPPPFQYHQQPMQRPVAQNRHSWYGGQQQRQSPQGYPGYSPSGGYGGQQQMMQQSQQQYPPQQAYGASYYAQQGQQSPRR